MQITIARSIGEHGNTLHSGVCRDSLMSQGRKQKAAQQNDRKVAGAHECHLGHLAGSMS
jgi:hypothetical protein